jgi:hypothetical protein
MESENVTKIESVSVSERSTTGPIGVRVPFVTECMKGQVCLHFFYSNTGVKTKYGVFVTLIKKIVFFSSVLWICITLLLILMRFITLMRIQLWIRIWIDTDPDAIQI